MNAPCNAQSAANNGARQAGENASPTASRKIVFATNNAHKLQEVRAIVGDAFEVCSLAEIGCHDDIPETAATLEGNALIKARWVKERYGYDCFADDTGLEVEALGGEPGVNSARYAAVNNPTATGHDSKANMALLLQRMEGVENRTARFRTVIALILGDSEHCFEGVVNGTILTAPRGVDGFGYDPIFAPENSPLTFAEMTADAKNAVSHRRRALDRFMAFFK
jgi:XTP/dITP diphosphohydrolase